jgi:hypothetical protein
VSTTGPFEPTLLRLPAPRPLDQGGTLLPFSGLTLGLPNVDAVSKHGSHMVWVMYCEVVSRTCFTILLRCIPWLQLLNHFPTRTFSVRFTLGSRGFLDINPARINQVKCLKNLQFQPHQRQYFALPDTTQKKVTRPTTGTGSLDKEMPPLAK